jgi:hypothetical protein
MSNADKYLQIENSDCPILSCTEDETAVWMKTSRSDPIFVVALSHTRNQSNVI